MHDYLVSYLRLIGFSFCALAVALCMRVGSAHASSPSPEPRFSAPPQESDMAAPPVAQTEEERIVELEARLTAVSAEIANLSKALDVLGPLPDHADLFIPIAMSDLDEPAPSVDIARRYSTVAPAANLVADMRFAGLGAFSGIQHHAADLGGLRAGYDVQSHNVCLNQDRAEDETVAALCVELSAISGPPRVVAPIRAW